MTASGDDFESVVWGVLPPDHVPADMAELADGWIIRQALVSALPANQPIPGDMPYAWAWEAASHLAYQYPAKAMIFILAVLARPLSHEARYGLAAGPLEDVLACHGPAVIDEVERLARQDAVFRDTLRGVWRNAMTDDIWERVQAAHGHQPSP